MLLRLEVNGALWSNMVPFDYEGPPAPSPVSTPLPAPVAPSPAPARDDTGSGVEGEEEEEAPSWGVSSARRSKIRIVERLENTLGVLDDLALTKLSDEALEAQTEVIIERMITQLVQVAVDEADVEMEVGMCVCVCLRGAGAACLS